jgi:pimeloyl-ACP methyl ester carboxylesterase
MKGVLSISFLLLKLSCLSQVNTFHVKPILTDVNYTAAQDSHLVVRNLTNNLDRLFLFIGGTGSSTQSYQAISNFAGNLGYDVITIAYPNTMAAASLSNSPDSLAFDKYRQELCYGTPLSPAVTVDTLNSIHTRTIKLIQYLNTTYPAQNWGQYLIDPTSLDWSKIVVGGHSQGGGHACYFAKSNDVARVLMFSSPNDYSSHFSNSANWLRSPGITPMGRHFAYLSQLDEVVPFSEQLTNLQGLGLYPLYDTTLTDISSSPYDHSHCLYTTQPPGFSILYHNSTVRSSSINHSVWTHMLTSPITTATNEVHGSNDLVVYPNPTHAIAEIRSQNDLVGKPYTIMDPFGRIIRTGIASDPHSLSIDLSFFGNGLYLLTIDDRTFRIIRQ